MPTVIQCLILFSLFITSLATVTTEEVCLKETKHSKQDLKCDIKPRNCRDFNGRVFNSENSSSIFYSEAYGRLGNQLLIYAMLSYFRYEIGVDAYISKECKKYLMKVFTPESIEIPVLDEVFCDAKRIPFESYNDHIRNVLTDKNYRKGRLIKLFPIKSNGPYSQGYRSEEHMSKEQKNMQLAYVKYIKENLKFKPNIMTSVKIAMKQVAKKMGLKPKQVTYIGVHNRRTDHLEFDKNRSVQEPLSETYFEDAIEYFRDEYDNPAFLYISDDMDWGRRNIKNDYNDIFFIGNGMQDDDSIAFDLAIMAYSNHTITSRGTFSTWGAILSGGEYYTEYGVIVPSNE